MNMLPKSNNNPCNDNSKSLIFSDNDDKEEINSKRSTIPLSRINRHISTSRMMKRFNKKRDNNNKQSFINKKKKKYSEYYSRKKKGKRRRDSSKNKSNSNNHFRIKSYTNSPDSTLLLSDNDSNNKEPRSVELLLNCNSNGNDTKSIELFLFSCNSDNNKETEKKKIQSPIPLSRMSRHISMSVLKRFRKNNSKKKSNKYSNNNDDDNNRRRRRNRFYSRLLEGKSKEDENMNDTFGNIANKNDDSEEGNFIILQGSISSTSDSSRSDSNDNNNIMIEDLKVARIPQIISIVTATTTTKASSTNTNVHTRDITNDSLESGTNDDTTNSGIEVQRMTSGDLLLTDSGTIDDSLISSLVKKSIINSNDESLTDGSITLNEYYHYHATETTDDYYQLRYISSDHDLKLFTEVSITNDDNDDDDGNEDDTDKGNKKSNNIDNTPSGIISTFPNGESLNSFNNINGKSGYSKSLMDMTDTNDDDGDIITKEEEENNNKSHCFIDGFIKDAMLIIREGLF